MSEGWQSVLLGEVCAINPDRVDRGQPNGLIRYIDISSVGIGHLTAEPQQIRLADAPSRAQRLVRHGDTILSTVRPVRRSMLRVSKSLDGCVASTGFAVLRADPHQLEPGFLWAIVSQQSFTNYLVTREEGAAYPAVSANAILEFEINLPPIREQRAIASTIEAIDRKLELNRQTNETLEAMARALFKDWFVDFGPTRAKMEGSEPYLAPDLWALFPDRLDEATGLPEGWITSAIGDEVRVVGGSTPSTKEPAFWDGQIHWATPKDLSKLTSPILLQTERKITEAGLGKISSGLLPVGAVLLSSRAPIGYLAISQVPVAINQGFIAMICEGCVSNVFVWLWTLENMDAILSKANGSTFQEISKTNFRPLPVHLPRNDLLGAFDANVMPIYQQIVQNEQETRTLSVTRDLLLPKLMSGEIILRDAEKIAGEAL